MTSDHFPPSAPEPRDPAPPGGSASPEPQAGVSPPAVAPPARTAPPQVDQPPGGPAANARIRLPATRTGNAWVALSTAAVVGVVVLVFILQNLGQAELTLFFWRFSVPLGVTILLSVIAGVLVMALVGGGRILQLRRAATRGPSALRRQRQI
ncbi:lipopolysaccharide assembly protein LapA domain-containing protein [Nocardia sp. NPDC051030]|uniref:LapA family protein n=1 Tax=Nocardia sp. NPDC051030 TaxID=3155162 RepID=UPI003442ED72